MNAPMVVAPMDDSTMITVLENSLYPGAAPTSISLALNYCRAAVLEGELPEAYQPQCQQILMAMEWL